MDLIWVDLSWDRYNQHNWQLAYKEANSEGTLEWKLVPYAEGETSEEIRKFFGVKGW